MADSNSSTETQSLVGQSLMFRFEGPIFSNEARAVFRTIRPCGVIFFADNITSRTQVHALTAELQAEAQQLGMPPLLIAADQEGGIVSRLPSDMVTPPGAMALSAIADPKVTERSARITGVQLRQVGINVAFAPVVDVNNNPQNPVIRTRSFGDSVEQVVGGALATIRGLSAELVVSCVKHFPGHGDTNVDSHLGLPVIHHSLKRMHQVELAPFKAAIAGGVPAVMSTHIVFPELDDLPATLSNRILTGLLRDELGFEGLIFTDSLSMDAIDTRYGLADSSILCKSAGVDVLESNESVDKQLVRFKALVQAVEDGTLDVALFASAVDRLNQLRTTFDLFSPTPPLPPEDPSLRAEAEQIARDSIVVIHNTKFSPIGPEEKTLVIDFQRLRSSEAEDPFNRGGIVREGLQGRLSRTRVATLSHQPQGEEVIFATNAARQVETLVVMTRDAIDSTYQVELAQKAVAHLPTGARVIHVALRGPYDAGILGPVDATVLSFGDPAVSLRAVVALLVGDFVATGTLPVALPDR